MSILERNREEEELTVIVVVVDCLLIVAECFESEIGGSVDGGCGGEDSIIKFGCNL